LHLHIEIMSFKLVIGFMCCINCHMYPSMASLRRTSHTFVWCNCNSRLPWCVNFCGLPWKACRTRSEFFSDTRGQEVLLLLQIQPSSSNCLHRWQMLYLTGGSIPKRLRNSRCTTMIYLVLANCVTQNAFFWSRHF
jgi:hypothetical protein